jgi:hypothetical protein
MPRIVPGNFLMRFYCLLNKPVKLLFRGLVAIFIFPVLSAVFINNPAISVSSCQASDNKTYLSKDYVDTVVQQAFYSLSAAMNIPGAEFKQKMAIEEARRVAQKLKTSAAGDPNEKYVLFRVGELEQQLWLEEKDIELQKSRETQKLKNAVIDTFNMELGEKRPEFSNLARLTARIDALNDPKKADEMKRSQAQRKTNISRELMYRFEKVFMSGAIDTARKEFEYCSRNRASLSIPDASFEKISKKIQMQADALKKKPVLEAALRRGSESLQKNLFKEAWSSVTSARSMLDQFQGYLALSDWNGLDGQCRALLAATIRKEDSLVNVTVSLYNTKGSDPALAYIEKTLKKFGVSENRVAAASTYVLSRGAELPKRDSVINREVDALSGSQASTEVTLDGIRERAKQKAKAKADSIRAADEARTSMLVLELYSLLERGKAEEAFNKFNANLVALETYVYPDALHTLSSSVTQAYQTWRDEKTDLEQMIATVAPSTSADDLKVNQEKASSHITQIYTMLEQGKAKEAFSLFKRIRDKLKQHTCKEAFDMVETMVNQAYASLSSSENSKGGRK